MPMKDETREIDSYHVSYSQQRRAVREINEIRKKMRETYVEADRNPRNKRLREMDL